MIMGKHKNLHQRIEGFFLKFRIRVPKNYEESKKEFSEGELEEFIQVFQTFDEIKLATQKSELKFSHLFTYVVFFKNAIRKRKPKSKKFRRQNKEQFILYNTFRYFILSLYKLSFFKLNLNEIYKLYDINDKQIDIELLKGIYFDYLALKKIKEIPKEYRTTLKNEFLKIKNSYKYRLENISKFWTEASPNLYVYKKSSIGVGSKKAKTFFMTEEILELLFNDVNGLKRISKKYFCNTITTQVIQEFIDLLVRIENSDLQNMLFFRFNEVFTTECNLSDRKKKLIIHDILLQFGHPEVYTELEQDSLLGKNENYTITAIEQIKIRKVIDILGLN